MKLSELRQLIREELTNEMARTAGTGNTFIISEEGKKLIADIKAQQVDPSTLGLTKKDLVVLAAIAKSDKPLSQIEVAALVCTGDRVSCQQDVNTNFRRLLGLELLTKIGYEKTSPDKKPSTGFDASALFADVNV